MDADNHTQGQSIEDHQDQGGDSETSQNHGSNNLNDNGHQNVVPGDGNEQGPPDLFQDIDMGLIELFRRNHYERFLAEVPPVQREERSRMLVQMLASRARGGGGGVNDYITFLWVFNIIPLPIIKYRRLWHDVDVTALLKQLFIKACDLTIKVFRFTMFLIGSSFYLQRTLRYIFLFGHELTFSQNFFGDILTFVLKNYQSVFERRTIIEGEGLKYLIALTHNYDQVPFWRYLMGLFYNFVALTVNCRCSRQPNSGQIMCEPNTSTLIFKFYDVFQEIFPGSYNDVYVILVYLAYAMIGNFICLNVFYFYGIYWTNAIVAVTTHGSKISRMFSHSGISGIM